jgi:pimeloyl-ACP methyl ester carboxylesterase
MLRSILSFCLILQFFAASSQSTSIRVSRTGKGDPVLFLPGFTCPGSVWNETIKNMEGKNEAYIISYAGFNGIAPIPMPWYQSIKKELIDYIKKEDLKKIKVIGHSMGGNLATDIAAEMPERFQKVIIVDAIPCMRELMMPGVPASQIQYENPFNKSMLAWTPEQTRKNAALMAGSMTNSKELTDSLVQWSLIADRETYVYGYTDLLKLDLRETLGKISAKVLILGADFPSKDQVMATYDKQYANLANKTVEIATNSKHFVMFDQSDWFYKKVNAFFAE